MKFKDLEKKTVSELNELLNDLRAESFTLGWKNKTQQQDQTHKIRLVKRDIARVLTALKQLELTNSINIKSSTKTKTTIKEGDK
ncbi:MAG: 50S ribosomal protein L29 [Mycoplasmataceae bacterium]|nr:50S ribosomal protein L29 [Mycoplasmataceae bacterium]MBR2999261.1 50S ribosomal protein L29 [Mycoplasmataceae bacterium]